MAQKPTSDESQEQLKRVWLEKHGNGTTAVAGSKAVLSENKYRGLFEATPVSLWEEDFSDVKQFVDRLHQQNITDFRAYFDANPQDVVHCINLVKVNDVNQATLRLYKAPDKKTLFSHLDKVFGLESFNLFKEELILIGEGKTEFSSEGINYTLDDEELNVVVRWSVSPGFEETLSQVIVSILDVTAQKKAEEQLKLQAAALESAANAIVITDEKGNIVWVNPAFTQLTGYSYDEAVGENPRILKSGKNREEIYADLWRTILAGDVWHCEELINRRKDGSYYYEEMTITPMKDGDGKLGRFVAIKEDISERKQTEQELQKQRDFAHQIMTNMGQGLLVLNAGRTIDFCNPAFANLLGYKKESLIGRSMMEFVRLDDNTQISGPTEAEHAKQKSLRELDLVHADGSLIRVLITAVPREGDIVGDGAICVVTDLSAQKKIENALAEARDQAIEATRLKSEFLANMSHEIRTPLNAVVGMTSLILDSPLTAEQHEYAQTIRSSSEVLLALINDILDFSKIEAGKLELEQRPFCVRDCVEEALDVVVTKAAEKALELAYIIDDEVPNDILGDVTRVRQILVNLLNNAIKFTNCGEVVLSVSCGNEAAANGAGSDMLLRFSVKDTGIGILPERLDRLFKSFSQVDASTTRKHGGTGLGLAISKQLVEMMGGQIWVESEYEKGSTFHFTIATRPAVSQRRVYTLKSRSQLKDKRVLIVDDNQTNCTILRKQAGLWGMEAMAVLSGAEALTLLKRGNPFDLAILDMQMPEMDGMMLAAEIRKLQNQKSLPLVMLSSIGGREEFKEAAYFSAILTKPVKQQLLFETLTAVILDTAVAGASPAQKLEIDPFMGKTHPLRILLAEDNLVNQKVALRILERMGYRADVAGHGLEVLESLQRQPYDAVLMDVQMPYMDGVEATQQIHEIWPPDEQPDIIAMTANALTGDREKYLAAGMDNYISKPVRIQELMEALSAVTPLSAKQKR